MGDKSPRRYGEKIGNASIGQDALPRELYGEITRTARRSEYLDQLANPQSGRDGTGEAARGLIALGDQESAKNLLNFLKRVQIFKNV